jgi:opacity protein-like surface antigen
MLFKRICLFTLLLTVSFLNAQVRIVADLGGDHKVSVLGISGTADTDMGITVGYDHMLSDNMGVGGEYQVNRAQTVDGEEAGKFGFTSVYGVGKYDLGGLYAVARAGYALMFSGDNVYKEGVDLKGGLMYGIGAGYKLNDNMAVEGGYYSNAGTGSVSEGGVSIDMDVTYTRANVSLVYSF